MSFYVLTYNIRVGTGAESAFSPDDPTRGLRRVLNFIKEHSPDIIALQEVDRFMPRTAGVDQAGWLATALDMHFVHSPSYLAAITHPNGRARYGNALLTRHPIQWSEAHHLFHRDRPLPGEPGWVNEPRSALEAAISIQGRTVNAYSVHLSTTADQQAVQVKQLVKALHDVPSAQVLMGDFNAELGSEPMQPLRERWTSALEVMGIPLNERRSYPSGSGAEIAIDHIFVNSGLRVKAAAVIVDDQGISDHNPVLAQLEFVD